MVVSEASVRMRHESLVSVSAWHVSAIYRTWDGALWRLLLVRKTGKIAPLAVFHPAPSESRWLVPDQKLFALCRRISVETDPQKLTAAVDELAKLLAEEQDEIKSRIAKMLSQSAIAPE